MQAATTPRIEDTLCHSRDFVQAIQEQHGTALVEGVVQVLAYHLEILLPQPGHHELPEMLRHGPADVACQQPAREIP